MFLLDLMKSFFVDNLDKDDRTAIATFHLPFVPEKFGLFAPSLAFWNQLLMLILLQVGIQCSLAVFIYKFVVKQRGTPTAFLVGFGVVIPLSLYLPFELIEALDIRNTTIRMALTAMPTIVFFRTVEAIFGTSPETVEHSVGTYVAYYSSLMHFEWDPKTKTRRKITSQELMQAATKIFLYFHFVSALLSFEMYHNFKPFPSSVVLDKYHFHLDLLSPAHLGNTYFLALLTFLVLSVGFDLTAFSENAKGFYTKPTFLNPLFNSRSPRDFWGRKWNLMIYRILKHGIFQPSRTYLRTTAAVIVTFLFSGLLHEYCWALLFYHPLSSRDESGTCSDCFSNIALKQVAFFLWNGAIMLLEFPLGRYFRFMKQWPTVVVSTLVLMTALPVSHWYTGDWAVGRYYSDFSIGLWLVRKI